MAGSEESQPNSLRSESHLAKPLDENERKPWSHFTSIDPLKLSNDSLCPCICEKRLRVFVLKL